MIIYGAGMAGLLAANCLRRFKPVIREAKEDLPNNHSALLRFRTPNVGTACGIPFKKVKVSKAISYENKMYTEPTLFLSNMYSGKVTGAYENRSINNLDTVDRYISPPNLIELMALNCKIEYNQKLTNTSLVKSRLSSMNPPIISTIPMPVMMDVINWEDKPSFRYKKIWTHTGTITDPEVDVYQTIYYPNPMEDFYRVSVIGNIVIAEYSKQPDIAPGPSLFGALAEGFGIKPERIADIKSSEQKYGKILPIEESVRRKFIHHLTEHHGIYSLGRFATWRQILLDDVVNDISVIEKFIVRSDPYERSLHNNY